MSLVCEVDVSCVVVIVFIGVIVLFSRAFFCPTSWSDPDVFLAIVLYFIFRELNTGSVTSSTSSSTAASFSSRDSCVLSFCFVGSLLLVERVGRKFLLFDESVGRFLKMFGMLVMESMLTSLMIESSVVTVVFVCAVPLLTVVGSSSTTASTSFFIFLKISSFSKSGIASEISLS